MRVLIVAPDQGGLNTIPEVRLIQTWHHTSTLNGTVTAEDVYQAARETRFDIIHFATHGGSDGVALSGGSLLTAEDIAQVARLKETPELFFNACSTGKLAAYAVRHGVRTAICAEVDILDNQAWKLPLAFYSTRRNGHAGDPIGAYIMADSGDGDYSLHASPDWIRDLERRAATASVIPHSAGVLTRREALAWSAGMTGATLLLILLILRLAGVL